MDELFKDIIDIFNMPEVELVRLSGLYNRENKIDPNITPQLLHIIIHKFKNAEIINYTVCCWCPHCREIFYIKEDKKEHKCDSCGNMFSINLLNIIDNKNIEGILI